MGLGTTNSTRENPTFFVSLRVSCFFKGLSLKIIFDVLCVLLLLVDVSAEAFVLERFPWVPAVPRPTRWHGTGRLHVSDTKGHTQSAHTEREYRRRDREFTLVSLSPRLPRAVSGRHPGPKESPVTPTPPSDLGTLKDLIRSCRQSCTLTTINCLRRRW